MNTTNPVRSYLWLFLMGIGGQAAGQTLVWLFPVDLARVAGGFLLGVSAVALGAYIYLTSQPRKASEKS